jgi:PleD family two-component response regulator
LVGDEFVIVMPGAGLRGGLEIAERISAAIASDGFAEAETRRSGTRAL